MSTMRVSELTFIKIKNALSKSCHENIVYGSHFALVQANDELMKHLLYVITDTLGKVVEPNGLICLKIRAKHFFNILTKKYKKFWYWRDVQKFSIRVT